MSDSAVLNILFVINPGSGTQSVDWEAAIHNFFEPLPHHTELFVLTGKNDAASLSDKINKNKYDRVVAVGGDGTVTLVARLLLGKNIALGILPAGSANGMARELDIPLDPTAALEVIPSGVVRCCDVIKINKDHICVHLSDIGLNAQLIKYFDEGKLRGKWGYARVILKTLWNRQKMQVIIESNKLQVRRKAFMVVLANARKYGTGAVINPEGDLHDGVFEVVIVRRLALSELIKMLYRPQPFNPKKIEVFSARSITINTQRRVHFQVDGEYIGRVNHLQATIVPCQLNILLPAERVEG
jgi:diacylglycerol kinase (ATP)